MAGPERRDLARLRQAWADYLRRFRWTCFLTLTHKMPCGRAGAIACTTRWIQDTEKVRSGHAFWVVERRGHGRWHAHVLIGGVGALTRDRLYGEWGRGWVSVERFDAERGAAYYVGKFTFDHDSEYDFEKFDVVGSSVGRAASRS